MNNPPIVYYISGLGADHRAYMFLQVDGYETKNLSMHENKEILVLSPGYWRKLFNFSPDAIVIVGADAVYDPHDYIHDWEEFLNWKKASRAN